MSDRLRRPVVVIDVPGASGLIAVRHLLTAPRDGSTLLSASPKNLVLLPIPNPHAGFRSDDLVPAARLVSTAFSRWRST